MNTQINLQSPGKLAGKAAPMLSSVAIYAATTLFGTLILLLDESLLDVVITPMLGLWWLMGVAFFRRPREVAIIGLILLVCVLSSLLRESIGTIVVRSASFIISSILAVLLARQKSQAADRYMQISRIIKSVPANVVAADEQGTIIAASDMVVELIGEAYQPVCGHVFTDVFMHHIQPAAVLSIYREWFQRSGRFDCDLDLVGHDNKPLKATAECCGSGDSRILVVMLQAHQ